MVFDRTWEKLKGDVSRLNPFSPPDTNKPDGYNRPFDTLDSKGRERANQQYNIDMLTYPLDLMDGKERANAPYMMIFINVPAADKMQINGKDAEFVKPHNPIRDGRTIRAGLTQESAIAASGLATAAIGGGLGAGLLGVSGIGLATGVGFVGAFIANKALGDIGATFNAEPKRLKAAIALHMPNQLDIRYGMQYKNDNGAPFLAYTKLLNTGVDTVKGIYKEVTSDKAFDGNNPTFKNIADQLKSGAQKMTGVGLNVALQLLPGGDTISASTGIAPNPKLQTVFEGVDPRSFSYGYSFFARSESELLSIYNIINLLKKCMHPNYKDSDQFLFGYPCTFDIEYYVGAQRNEYLHKHTSCVLTNLSVDYTPNGSYTYFNKNGAPIQINVRMDFRELEILTDADINEGF